jgi:hypothetical protein
MERLSQGGLLKEMATVRKGSGTAVRRRTKKEVVSTKHETNGTAGHNGAAGAESNIETIRLRAYERFLARGATHGEDLADWFNAERELCEARTS